MKRDFIIELGVEEVPAGFINGAIESFHNLVTEKLRSLSIGYEKSYYYSTPRRFVVYVTGVDETQKDQVEEIKGPPKRVGFSDIGRPTQAALGFAQTNNVSVNDITVKSTPKGEYLYVTKTLKGQPVISTLPEMLKSAIAAIPFAKSMKWDDSETRFARPIRWILCLFGEETVKFTFGRVESGNITYSLRRHNQTATVQSPGAYFETMKKFEVVVDAKSRCNQILTGLNSMSEKLGMKPYKDENLIAEVANLTENPEPILCEFDPKFLKVPEKILTSTMVKNQRYFPIYDSTGKLSCRFAVFSNGKPLLAEEVKYGNQKVITARFADAEFYYNEDLKTTMEAKAEKLKTVLFQQKLGSVHEKAERISKLAQYLYSNLITRVQPQEDYKAARIEKIKKCAELCKADLTSEVVKEFTELQGYAGMVYAGNEGKAPEVAKGIYEHYKPCFKGDTLPETLEGQCVGIADKMDTIAGCFVIKMIPTGSGDPYALRRAALGIVEIAINSAFSFDFKKFAQYAIGLFSEKLRSAENCDIEKTANDISNFIKQRFETKLKETGLRYDVVNAVLWNGVSNIYEDNRKAASLAEARASKEFLALAVPFKRAVNITKNQPEMTVNKALLTLDVERGLYETYEKVRAEVEKALESNNYTSAFNALSALNGPIDKFFTGVMVMDPDTELKNNRIAVLQAIKELFFRFVDISQLVIEE